MTQGMRIRSATQRERDDAAKQWASSFAPGNHTVTVGSTMRTIALKHWKRAHKMLVAYLLAESNVHVLVLDDVPSEPLGWIAWTPDETHYVYVLEKARRCGLGRKLLEFAASRNLDAPASHMTASGRSLEGDRHVQEEAQAAPQVLSEVACG